MTQEAVEKSRGVKWVMVPTLIVLFLAVAWSGLWFYASRVADRTIGEWIEREAQVGRIYGCASRAIGGFPFRFELRCANPTVELRGGSVPIVLKARELLAVAQIYRPDLLIAEVSGPMTVGNVGEPAAFSVDWALLQASVRGLPAAPERVSIVFDRARLNHAGGAADLIASADKAEFHVRRATGDAANPAFDIVSRLAGASIPSVPLVATSPLNAELSAVLRGINDLLPKPVPVRLREWQAAGGRLEITQARVAQGEALGVAMGALGLTSEGRLDGAVNLTVAGFDQMLRTVTGGQSQGLSSMGLLAGLAILGGRTELEGKRAVAVPMRFDRGAFFLGPIRVGQTGTFF